MAIRGKQPTKLDLAYIAGFIDGEGSIGLYKRTPRGDHNPEYIVQITIVQVEKEVLEYIKSFFGGCLSKKKIYSDKHRQSYQLKFTHNKAVEFAEQIEPYLIIKREQAKLIKEFRENKILINRKQPKFGGKWLSKKEVLKRAKYYEKSKKMNIRGVQPQRLTEMTS